MVGSIEFHDEKYNFTADTWRKIYAYEAKLRGEKKFKKVNFKDNEMQNIINWVVKTIHTGEFQELVSMPNFFFKMHGYVTKESKEKEKKLKDYSYLKAKLQRSLKKNKYYMAKISRCGFRYRMEDIREFLLVLTVADEYDLLSEFIQIPDVCYILKNIIENYSDIIGRSVRISQSYC